MLKSIDGGTTWTPQTSNTTQALNGVACVNAGYCFAAGAVGTTIATGDGGTTWTQQGNPMSGPTSAINATSIALNGAGCNAARCFVGLGAQGDILTTPLLTVTVHATGVYGSTPSISLPANSPLISYSPASEAANVTGTLTCTTTAVAASPVASYPITTCTGLADDGFNVVYDYANSNYTVTKAPLTVTADNKSRLFGQPNPPLTATLSGFVLGQNARHLGRHRPGGLHDDGDAVLDRRHLPDHLHAGDADRGELQLRPVRPRHAHGRLLAAVHHRAFGRCR